ncbi:MAG: hypothetical protein V1904_00400 [Bacteroidota bacterium]
MMKKIAISENTPRNPKDYSIMLIKGLRPYYFCSYFFTFGVFIPVFMILLSPGLREDIPYGRLLFCIFIFSGVGILLWQSVSRRYRKRKLAFKHGRIISGTVKEHGRKMVYWKHGTRDYTLTVEVAVNDYKQNKVIIQSGNSLLHTAYPIGTPIKGFYDEKTGSFFFPAEIEIEIS